jgi:hypothetical protein
MALFLNFVAFIREMHRLQTAILRKKTFLSIVPPKQAVSEDLTYDGKTAIYTKDNI